MCGIFWHMYKCKDSTKHSVYESVIDNVKRRGPDGCLTKHVELTYEWKADIVGSVKWTQGQQVQLQPITLNDNVLLWNGDVFKGQLKGDENDSDSTKIMEWLEANNGDVTRLVLLLKGPYSIVYWNNEEEILWFGRDPLGRHSLLWSFNDDEFLVTSVGHKSLTLTEVPAVGIFSVSLRNKLSEGIHLHAWSHCDSEYISLHSNMGNINVLKDQISALNFHKLIHEDPSEDGIKMFDQYIMRKDYDTFYVMLLSNSEIEERVKTFYQILCNSISIRVKTCPKIYTDNRLDSTV